MAGTSPGGGQVPEATALSCWPGRWWHGEPLSTGGDLEKGRASWAEGPQPQPSFACSQSREFPHFFPSASSRTFCRVTFVPTQGGATAAAAKCHRSALLPAGTLGANPPAWGSAGPWAAQGMARTLPSTLAALVWCRASRQTPPPALRVPRVPRLAAHRRQGRTVVLALRGLVAATSEDGQLWGCSAPRGIRPPAPW